MFKQENSIWLYLIGILIMFGILIYATQNFLIPFVQGEVAIDFTDNTVDQPNFEIDLDLNYIAELNTNLGTITVDLYENSAPNNVNNFIYLSDLGYYEGTTFFRLIPDLLVQGGDRNTLNDNPEDDGLGNPGYLLDDEVNFESLNLSQDQINYLRGLGYDSDSSVKSNPLEEYSIAMANDGPDTNGSQFFFILAPTSDARVQKMNGQFTVIGKVINGKEILDRMKNLRVDNPNLVAPRPVEPITLESIRVYTQ